ncbi:MAG: TIGR03618 family F420-dependent PPOX class oxidoreductase [Acidimicrobiales bacterium]
MAPIALPPTLRAALEAPLSAHLVTLNADGSAQVTIVWVGVDGDELVTAHLGAWQKVRNVTRDPRIVVSLETGTTDERGLAEYAVIHGTARVTEGGAPALLQELAHRYLGPSVPFPPMADPPPGYIMHIAIDRITGNGPWARGD